jgi:hypothetical protein
MAEPGGRMAPELMLYMKEARYRPVPRCRALRQWRKTVKKKHCAP